MLGGGFKSRTKAPTAPKSPVFVAACALSVVRIKAFSSSGLVLITGGASATAKRPRPASLLRRPKPPAIAPAANAPTPNALVRLKS